MPSALNSALQNKSVKALQGHSDLSKKPIMKHKLWPNISNDQLIIRWWISWLLLMAVPLKMYKTWRQGNQRKMWTVVQPLTNKCSNSGMAFLFNSTWDLAGTYFLHWIQEALSKFRHENVYCTASKENVKSGRRWERADGSVFSTEMWRA